MGDANRPPTFGQIDAWGLTHAGKVREENMDHFLVGSISRGVTVHASSVGPEASVAAEHERLASLAIVADGVGSTGSGENASREAVLHLVREVSTQFHTAMEWEETEDTAFTQLLEQAALDAHEKILAQAESEEGGSRAATTLTLFLGLWPHGYLLQVGDSRCYMFRDGELTQISQDQTMAQALIDEGVLTQTKAHATRWANVLSSALGGQQAAPVVTRFTRKWGTVLLLCSDGLTKHVSDDTIRDAIRNMRSSRQLCEDLLQLALDAGGTDNITIVVGRTIKPEDD